MINDEGIGLKAQNIMDVTEKKCGGKNEEYIHKIYNFAIRMNNSGEEYYVSEILLMELKSLLMENEDVNYATVLYSLAKIYSLMERYKDAEQLFLKSLTIFGETTGEHTINYAASLCGLANLYNLMERYKDAEQLFLKSQKAYLDITGEDNMNYVASLQVLADLYSRMGKFKDAEMLFLKGQKIYREANGGNAMIFVQSLHGLAILYSNMRRSLEAEPLLLLSLKILREEAKENSMLYATILVSLADLYSSIGRHKEAEQIFFQSYQIFRVMPDKSIMNHTALVLANIYSRMGRYVFAEPIFLRLLNVRGGTTSKNTISYSTCLHSAASLYGLMGRYKEAELLFLESQKIIKKKIGENTTDYAASLCGLADLYSSMGKYSDSVPLFVNGLNVFREMIGENNMSFAASQRALAHTYILSGKVKDAFSASLESVRCSTNVIKTMQLGASSASINAIKEYILPIYNLFFSIITNYAQLIESKNDFISYLAEQKMGELYASGLRMKLFDENATADEKNKSKEWIEELRKLQESTKKDEVRKAEVLKESLWLLESSVISKLNETKRSNDLDYLNHNRGLNENETVLEYFWFEDLINTDRDSGYCAIVYKPNFIQDAEFVFLGDGSYIEEKVGEIRKLINDTQLTHEKLNKVAKENNNNYFTEKNEELVASLKELREKVIEPVRPFIPESGKIIICPDGELTKIPFELMLPNYDIRYLTSGTDDQWIGLSNKKNETNIICGNPICGHGIIGNKTGEIDNEELDINEQTTRAGFPMGNLKYAGIECEKIAEQLKDYKNNLVQKSAFTKAGFMEFEPARILHISTHGYFFEHKKTEKKEVLNLNFTDKHFEAFDDPYERCGLAASMANLVVKNHEYIPEVLINGNDIMKKDLRGTELVVLSACNTGLGDVKNGDGVYGLQRAFFLSGIKTLVMSLWSVDDLATCILMNKMYAGIIAGERVDKSLKMAKDYISEVTIENLMKDGWGAELKEAKVSERFNKDDKPYMESFYWAGFICMGDGGAVVLQRK